MSFSFQFDNFKIDIVENGSFAVNNYLIYSTLNNKAILFDAGEETDLLLQHIKKNNLTLDYLIITHAHSDHIAGNQEIIAETNAKLLCHNEAVESFNDPMKNLSAFLGTNIISPKPFKVLDHNEIFHWEGIDFKVLHCPGHSPCSIVFSFNKYLICGDVLFKNSIGRTDLPFSEHNLLISSIKENILTLPPETIVLPGHGPDTTIQEELNNNPYI